MKKQGRTLLGKKLVTSILCFGILLTQIGLLNVSAFAVDTSKITSDLWVAESTVFSEVFSDNTQRLNGLSEATQSTSITDAVTYSYIMGKENGDSVPVSMDFTINANGTATSFSVSGSVAQVPYQDKTYYEGNLVGEAIINGTDYSVSAGFQKLSSSDNVKVGLVLTPEDGSGDSLIMTFGNSVLSYDELNQFIEDNTSTSSDFSANAVESSKDMDSSTANTVEENLTSNSSESYELICSTPGKLDSYTTMYQAMRMNFSYAAYPYMRGIMGVKSYCDDVSDSMEDIFASCSTKVYKVTMDVSRSSGVGYIADFNTSVTFPKNQTFAIDDDIRDSLVDILSWVASFSEYNVPTFFINWIADNLNGDVKTTTSGSEYLVEYDFSGFFDNANFDDGFLPISYQFAANGSGKTYYSLSANVKYRCYVKDSWGDSTVLYLTTNNATSTLIATSY